MSEYPEFDVLRSSRSKPLGGSVLAEDDVLDSLHKWAPGLDKTTRQYMESNNIPEDVSPQDMARHTVKSLQERWRAAHVGRFRLWGFTAGDCFGLFAGILSFIAIMVQIGLIYQRKSACDISMGFILINIVVQLATFTFGIMNQMRVQVITGTGGMLVVGWLLALKLQFDRGGKCSAVREVAAMYAQGTQAGLNMQEVWTRALRVHALAGTT